VLGALVGGRGPCSHGLPWPAGTVHAPGDGSEELRAHASSPHARVPALQMLSRRGFGLALRPACGAPGARDEKDEKKEEAEDAKKDMGAAGCFSECQHR